MQRLRFAPLTGVAAVILIAAGFAAPGSTPAPDAPLAQLVSYYAAHETGQLAAGATFSLGALLFLAFATTVVVTLRSGGGSSAAIVFCMAGAIVVVVGLTIEAGLELALGDVAKHLSPASLQAVHVLSNELIFTLTVGTSAFLIGAGLATMKTRVLPRWTGWLALVFGVVSTVPSHIFGGPFDHIGFAGVVGLGVWTLIASILLARQTPA
jgi:hypothetical protein